VSHVVPDAHPDRDTLADLAADVLPPGQAAELQAHVQACEQCAGLLADAERVRGLLLADDPGPMPAHVLARIETVLAEQPRPASMPTLGAPGRARPPVRPGRPARAARGPQRTRRQVREEQRGGGPGRRGTLLLAAAAVALVLAGGLGLRQLFGGGNADMASSAGGGGDAAAEQAPAAAADQDVVVATGTQYTEQKLAGQVGALVKRVSAARAQAGDSTQGGTGLQRQSAGDEALRSPAALQNCLAALDSGGEQPLAVDLARYENREAAIVVLPGRDGGYEVWAVARSCGPDGDGTLKFATVRP
jgi:hypothetical protein